MEISPIEQLHVSRRNYTTTRHDTAVAV